MNKPDFDLIVCRIDSDATDEELQRRITEKFPQLKIKNANGAIDALIALGATNYRAALIVTAWKRINAAHYMVGQVRLAGIPLHCIFVYAREPGDSSERLQAFQNDFAQGQEDQLLEALDNLLK